MKKYSWFCKIGKSLTPSDFYIDILNEPLRKAIFYMISFILLLSLLVGTYNGIALKNAFEHTIADYDAGLIPQFTLIDGVLDIEGTQPIIISYFNDPIILDDDSNYNINDMLSHDNITLLESNRFIVVRNEMEPLIRDYKDFITYNLTSKDLRAVFSLSSIISIPLTILFQFLFSLSNFFFNSLFVVLIANVIRTTLRLEFKFKQLYHMTIYAMTFPMFWTHFTLMLSNPIPPILDSIVYYVVPILILLTIFINTKRKAMKHAGH